MPVTVKKMNTIKKIKRVAAIVLFVTFFLPLSQCQKSHYKIVPQTSAETGETIASRVEEVPLAADTAPEYSYNIAAEMFEPADVFSWLVLLAFTWPLLFWAWQIRDKRSRTGFIMNALEPLACIGSGYITWNLSFLGDILIWGYLSMASVLTYFLSSCYELSFSIKARLISQP